MNSKDLLDNLESFDISTIELGDVDLNEIEIKATKNILKRNIKSKRSQKMLLMVASFLSAIITFGVCFPVYGQEIPIVKNIIEYLNRNNEIEGYAENTQPIVSTIKIDGYTLNIQSVYYNGIELSIFYNIVGKEKLNLGSKYWFTCNVDIGKSAMQEYSLEYGEPIDDYTYAGMITMYIRPHDESTLPDVINGKINITGLNIGGDNSIEVKSEPIKLNLNSNGIEVKEYNINKEVSYSGLKKEFIKAKEYPTGIYIKSEDENNRSINNINYFLWDSNKGPLKMIAGIDMEDGQYFQYRLPGKESDVYILPWVTEENPNYSGNDVNKLPFKLETGKQDFGKNGTIEIKNIEEDENYTYLKVRVTGDMSTGNFYFTGGKGEGGYYRPLYEKDKKINGFLDMEVTYVFTKLDRSKTYYIDEGSSVKKFLIDDLVKIER